MKKRVDAGMFLDTSQYYTICLFPDYFDKQSDCNKAIRNIYDYEAIIEGHGSGSQERGPESCSIR